MIDSRPGRPWRNIALMGYRGAGKSSVAAALSQRMGWPWIDTDREVERLAGCSIAVLFAEQGEPAMRDLESRVLREQAGRTRTILALGGGAVLREENRDALRNSWTLWLQASPATLAQRLSQDEKTAELRPQLTSLGTLSEIEHVLESRREVYQQAAWRAVCTEGRRAGQHRGNNYARIGVDGVRRPALIAQPVSPRFIA